MQYTLNDMSKSVEIKVSEHRANFLHGMSEVRRVNQFFDIKLCIGAKEIDSHQAVLAAFSPYFSDHFDDAFVKSREDRIHLTNKTNFTVLASILDYMYSGSISFQIEDGAMLMSTLDLFKMQSVKDLCEAYLVNNIDAENCLALFNVSEEVPLQRLKQATVHYINKHFPEIHGSDEFKKLTKDQLESVIQKTRYEDAKTTYQAIVGWIKYDTPNRKDYVEQLLKYVSIKHLPASYLWEYIAKDDFLKNDVGGRQWLLSSLLDPKSPIRPHQTLHILSTLDKSNYEWDVCDKFLTTREYRPELNCYAIVKHDRSIYAFGKGVENEIGGIGFKYDTITNEWTRVVAGNILIKPLAGICSHGDGIYLIGGLKNIQPQQTCARYDVETSQWTTLPDLKYARRTPGVVSCNSLLYVFGGYHSISGTLIERYDHREGKWFGQSYVKLESWVSSAVVSEYNICCLQQYSDNVINFDTRSFNCTDVTSKMGSSLASLDGRLYIAHKRGIAEYNPYAMKWDEILQKKLWRPVLIA